MAITDQRRSRIPVPLAVELPDRIPKERFYDPGFFQQEVDLMWSRTWQMACRLEEILQPDDFTEYQILDQSIIVVRTEDGGARALQNACGHRGASDPHSGLLEPPPSTAGRPRQELRVPAPVRGDRGRRRQLPTNRRRLPRRPPLRATAPALPQINLNPLEQPVVDLGF